VGAQACPRHARPLGAGSWAGRIARLSSAGPPAGHPPLRGPARRDPLLHPVAITEHCFIGDQIRVPAAWCDMPGCRSRFADPAALGEADNRARALARGWGHDDCGRLVCPACQPRPRGPAPPGIRAGGPQAAAAPAPSGGARGPHGGMRRPVRALLAWWHRALGHGRHRGTQWLQLLLALATGSNGWTAPRYGAVPGHHAAPGNTGARADRPSAAPLSAPGRPAQPRRRHRRPAKR
jgi:hypothetical protein